MSVSDHVRFTQGDCHILAQEIHARTGWSMAGINTGEDYPDAHAFVLTPNGDALDVTGVCSVDEMKETWEKQLWPGAVKGIVVVHDPAEFRDWGQAFPASPKRAAELAPRLIELARAS